MKDLIFKLLYFFSGKLYSVVDQPYVGHIIVELNEPTYSPEFGGYIADEEIYMKEDVTPSMMIAEYKKKKKVKQLRKERLAGCKWYNVWKADRAFKSGKIMSYSDYMIVAKTGLIPEKSDAEIL